MKGKMFFSTILCALIIQGCEGHSYIRAQRQVETPPEIMGGGGGSRITDKVEVGVEGCWGGHPACKEKPDNKEKVEEDLRKLNLLLQQQNTHSVPVNNKLEIKVVNGGGVVSSAIFDATVVGNQIRFGQPSMVADWVYPHMDNGNSVRVATYLTSTGFESENITVNARYDSRIIAATTLLIEIDCGPDHPWVDPSQGCVIIP
mgnify:CR=1 FL=1